MQFKIKYKNRILVQTKHFMLQCYFGCTSYVVTSLCCLFFVRINCLVHISVFALLTFAAHLMINGVFYGVLFFI